MWMWPPPPKRHISLLCIPLLLLGWRQLLTYFLSFILSLPFLSICQVRLLRVTLVAATFPGKKKQGELLSWLFTSEKAASSLDDEPLWLLQDNGSSLATVSPPCGHRDRSQPAPGKAVCFRDWNVSLREREHKSLDCWPLHRNAWHCLLHRRRPFSLKNIKKRK